MMKKQILIAWILLLNINLVQACETEKKRIALVIGNSNYQDEMAILKNPKNDASGLAQTLKTLGFYVFEEYDLTKAKMETVIQKFGSCLKQAGGIGLFYYSGHGVQFEGKNYLIPVDGSDALDSKEEDFLQHNIVSAEKMLKVMENAKNDANIIIIDACRNNPTRGKLIHNNGLDHLDPPSGSIIAYAAAPGKFALDGGVEDHSPYAKHLIKEITKPKVSITDVFLEVRKGVKRHTNDYQEPQYLSLLNRKIYLNDKPIEFTVKKYQRSKRIFPPRQAIKIINISKNGNSINYWKFPWQKQWHLPSQDVYNDFIKSVGSSLKSKELLDMAIKKVVSKY
ncbi:caspase family protein [Candidatus Marithrix sp. Canyon 246]|uniref:caspase family protein n=1 Tax=Candidatus Marithrix sp. Canyon 246 TaxID=1827136 RepID=UPI00084A1D18|nr:caspase family protein [Candidatus Marithrix sp. Canyon 246]